jgi:hypothetical protein
MLTLLVGMGIGVNAETSRPLRATTYTYCPAANPYDNDGDTAALQDCVDNYDVVVLTPPGGDGYVGYIIDDNEGNGIRIRNLDRDHGPVLMTDGDGSNGKALLIADPDLTVHMIDAYDDNSNNWELHQLVVDGNRYNRTNYARCAYDAINQQNIRAKGSSFEIVGVESVRALCGSGMEVEGQDFEIYTSAFVDNGTPVPEASVDGEWADGLTLNRCDGAYIHDNSFYDNTDVDLLVSSGVACGVARNSIFHLNKVGVAGMNIGGAESGASLEYANIWDDGVFSYEGLLGVGAVIGSHAWDSSGSTSTVGEIWNLSLDGATKDLAIDGIDDGYIHDISVSRNRGSASFGGCTDSYDYTAGHFGSATIPSGYTSLVFDGGYCHTP